MYVCSYNHIHVQNNNVNESTIGAKHRCDVSELEGIGSMGMIIDIQDRLEIRVIKA